MTNIRYTKAELIDKLCFEVVGLRIAQTNLSHEEVLSEAILLLRNRKQRNIKAEETITQLEEQLEVKDSQVFTPQDLFTAAAILGVLCGGRPVDSTSDFALDVARKICKGRNPS